MKHNLCVSCFRVKIAGLKYGLERHYRMDDWDIKLLVQRLCEAFNQAQEDGKKEVDLVDFHSHFKGIEFEVMKEILQSRPIKDKLIEMDDKVMKLTEHGIEECKRKHPKIPGYG